MNVSVKYLVITGIICLAIGIALGWTLLERGTQKADIKIKYGENELNINLDKNQVEAAKILEQIFSEDFSKQGTLKWLKDHQHLYQANDPAIIPEISSMNYEDIVAEKLRVMSIMREGPWAYQYDTVFIGIPDSAHQPRPDYANACANGKYFMQKIRIYSMDERREIEVVATGKYDCPARGRFPDIQLNPKDAEKLLGNVNFSQYEKAMALILVQN
jgi:hypothetical protein